MTLDSAHAEAVRAQLKAVLDSQAFSRSPGLSRLLSYLCEKVLSGEASQIKEYSIALDVFGRQQSFDQDSDSIVRVQANRLRKRLAEFYEGEGRLDRIRITIPVGQYVAVFEENHKAEAAPDPAAQSSLANAELERQRQVHLRMWIAMALAVLGMAAVFSVIMFLRHRQAAPSAVAPTPASARPTVGLPVGDEIRILAGSTRTYVDRSGKAWSADSYFTGGTAIRSTVQHIWRTQDPVIYRTSRQGDFRYDIPLKPGIYELRLHFAETYYGPEDVGGGGEGSRLMTISANGKPLLNDFDVLADAAGGRTADVKVFTDISPASDGLLHLAFSSANGGGMLSAIEILPGYRGRVRPVRIVARDVPYYSNDSQWWSSDAYFKGGQLAGSEETAAGTDDPELYETERWGHFSYAIPVTSGEYKLTLYFIERGVSRTTPQPPGASAEERVFDVFCNGKLIIRHLDLKKEAGENRPVIRKFSGLQPSAQGKLLLEFVPLNQYATVSAIEVVPE